MRGLVIDETIPLSDDDLTRVLQFAYKVYATNQDEYARRKQDDPEKIVADIAIGKAAELAVSHYLDTIPLRHSAVDFKIYDRKHKSFDPDLMVYHNTEILRCHVKTMRSESATRFGLSWSFHITDPLILRPVTNDYIIFCESFDRSVTIKALSQAALVIPTLVEPVLPQLRPYKRVADWNLVRQYLEN